MHGEHIQIIYCSTLSVLQATVSKQPEIFLYAGFDASHLLMKSLSLNYARSADMCHLSET